MLFVSPLALRRGMNLPIFVNSFSAILDGRISGMKSSIDSAGRLVVPKAIREQARLKPGVPVEIRWRSGVIEIEPAPVPVKLRRRGRFLVAVPEKDIPELKSAEVQETRRTLRRDRLGE